MSRQPWDHGLQVERTALAWIRTSVSLVLVALLAFRFAVPHYLVVSLVLLTGIATFATVAGVLSWRRYRTTDDRLTAGRPLPGGALAAVVTAMTVLTGVLGLIYVLARAT